MTTTIVFYFVHESISPFFDRTRSDLDVFPQIFSQFDLRWPSIDVLHVVRIDFIVLIRRGTIRGQRNAPFSVLSQLFLHRQIVQTILRTAMKRERRRWRWRRYFSQLFDHVHWILLGIEELATGRLIVQEFGLLKVFLDETSVERRRWGFAGGITSKVSRRRSLMINVCWATKSAASPSFFWNNFQVSVSCRSIGSFSSRR